ncbi:MAG: nickel pincer cofactor biosynthesis protein LarB [Planctomycetaceae bacterium]|nr:nickel pincer cofactor biosynthesis protein LarB [Planctomycetaceae bacterium]
MHEILKHLSERFLRGELPPENFIRQLSPFLPQGDSRAKIAHVGEAQLDLERGKRCGFPEVVFAEGKSSESLEKIFSSLVMHDVNVLATRMTADKGEYLLGKFPAGRYNPIGRTFRIPPKCGEPARVGKVAIITAGTSDMPVAEEARETADWTGAETLLIQDIGVAGPHRLQANRPLFEDADVVVVCAGMEGALPSVVGGYVSCPVVAVPTSVGYGASFGGLAALLGMLNSCASNVTVVNIDAGFKGGYVAGLIAKNRHTKIASTEVG